MSQGDQDKTEDATPFRLEEAKKRGEVAKSQDITGSLVMIVGAAIIAVTAGDVAMQLVQATRRVIELAGNAPALGGAFFEWVSHAYTPVGQALVPLLLGLIVVGVVANVAQTGPIFTTHPITPDFKRLNPMQTIKRIFSMRTLWELGKLTARAVFLVAICAIFAWKARALAEAAANTLPEKIGGLTLTAFVKTSVYVLLVIGLVALADLLFTRREYMKKMRMSRRELKDEVKRQDGDPHVKSKQKQQIRELLKKTRALGRVPEADVIITNPTHVAVALRYRPGETMAPVVVAKGAGFLSARIRQLASKHRVPMVRIPPLARALYRECDIDGMVPPALYPSLGPVYRKLWAQQQGARA